MNEFLKLYFIFSLIFGCKGQSFQGCDFEYQLYKSRSNDTSIHYGCLMDTSNFFKRIFIGGPENEHVAGLGDNDVTMLSVKKSHTLTSISPEVCDKFTNLQVIDLSGSNLNEFIPYYSLLACGNLLHLDLSNSKIQDVSEFLLYLNKKLISVQLQNNQLTTIKWGFFDAQEDLLVLDLNNNQIDEMPDRIFLKLSILEELYLSNNKLQSLNEFWFITLKNLKILSLSGNEILEITSKLFKSQGNLKQLKLNENRIQILNEDSFDGLLNLEELDLSNNEISSLPFGVFTDLVNLQALKMEINKLTTIHSKSFGIHKNLEIILLQNNQIEAIDEKFIDNTEISVFDMTNNKCSDLSTTIRMQIKPNLKECFMNYQALQI